MRVVPNATARALTAAMSLVLACAATTSAQIQASAATTAAPQATQGAPVRALTVDEAVRLALEQNVSLQVERLNPRIQDEIVSQAQGAWAPSLFGTTSFRDASNPPNSFLSGSTDTLQTRLLSAEAGIEARLPWGSQYRVSFDTARSTTNNEFSNFNPELGGGLNLRFIQPLLRDRQIDNPRQQLVVSKRNREISDITLRGTVVSTIRTVKNAYWDLKYAMANLEVQRQSLDLARQTLKDNRTRVEVGTMAPIDIVEAESEVARNEEAVIVAEAGIKQAEDALRALIFDPATPAFWTMTLDPVDAPVMSQPPIDVDGAVRTALDKRTDLQQARKNLDTVDDNIKYYKNQLLPQLTLQADVNTAGLGGTQFLRGSGFPPPVIGEVDRGYGNVLGDSFTFDYPTWTFAVNVSYPLGKSTTEATLARTRIEKTQGELSVKNLELQVGTQVRNLGRNVNTNLKRIEATRATRQLNERRLEAEQKKFAVGTSTSFLVFQAQRDLATARANELKAIVDYNKSLVDFEAVQEAAIGGGGVSIAGTAVR
jgi:outer membrane protein TolC